EPVAQPQEIEFLLQTAGRYLAKSPGYEDILSIFAGIRPLIGVSGANTAALSRGHMIRIEKSAMVTLCGGKWTTYRHMADDCVDQAATLARLPDRPCITADLRIQGPKILHVGRRLHGELPYTESDVVEAVRTEMARTVEDVLARRTRALFLRAAAAIEMAPEVAGILAKELDRDPAWEAGQVEEFKAIAQNYLG